MAEATARTAFAVASATSRERHRLALRLVDRGRPVALGLQDRRLLRAVGDVDLLLALAFALGDHRALLALRRDLRLHRAQDRLRRREALDLVAQHLDPPGASRLVEDGDDHVVDLVAALEGLVELHLADHAAQRRLGELRDREHVVRGAVGGELRVDHLEVDDPVHRELRVVLGDADLLGDVQRHFLERVLVGHAVDEGHDHVEPRGQHLVELAQALDHPGLLLGDDADALDDQHDDHRDEERGDGDADALGEERGGDRNDERDDDLHEHVASLGFGWLEAGGAPTRSVLPSCPSMKSVAPGAAGVPGAIRASHVVPR